MENERINAAQILTSAPEYIRTQRFDDEMLSVAQIRQRLQEAEGSSYWRSLEELSETEAFEAFLDKEFPRQAAPLDFTLNRRGFMKLLGASMALGGLTACVRPNPQEKIVPYVKTPEALVPGKPVFFASALTQGGYAQGVLVENHDGRPTHIAGNPSHPASLGAANAQLQAEVLSLYDPDRSRTPVFEGRDSDWEEVFKVELAQHIEGLEGGAGLAVLTETITSPTLAAQLQALRARYPEATWVQYNPINNDNILEGAKLAFGQAVTPVYDFTKADVVLALDSDFTGEGPGHVRYAHDFASRRKLDGEHDNLNRFYAVESTLGVTSSFADHRLPLESYQIGAFLGLIAHELGLLEQAPDIAVERVWLEAVLEDLKAAASHALVVVGPAQPPEVHALAHAVNLHLGNTGETVTYQVSPEAQPENQGAALEGLVSAMAAGDVKALIILGGNPVYNAPAELNFAAALGSVDFSAHLSLYYDETSSACTWHVNAAHELETWGDGRAFDGTASIQQPMIQPLYNGKSALDMVNALLGDSRSAYDTVREFWQTAAQGGNFDLFWSRVLYNGVVDGTQAAAVDVSFDEGALAGLELSGGNDVNEIEVVFRSHPSIGDGRYANNAWLQEVPDPFTKMTWDNTAFISPSLADQNGLKNQDVIEITADGRSITTPVWVQPGQAANTITLFLGYGRESVGAKGELDSYQLDSGGIGEGIGVNVYPLRTLAGAWSMSGATVTPTSRRADLVTTAIHHNLDTHGTGNRHIVRAGTAEEYEALVAAHGGGHAEDTHSTDSHATDTSATDTHGASADDHSTDAHSDDGHGEDHGGGHGGLSFVHPVAHHQSDLYSDYTYDSYAWGMVVDLNSCNGCNACIIACQSENNIPVVGKQQVSVGREMQWIRVDAYYRGDLDNPEFFNMPIMCMHCEKAPCESVCPVEATVHDDEGLNVMVYNRCVGTRYCSNNCPYKVRRFNFLQYAELEENALAMLQNPDVTVRSRGVMEKCTYCIQRIQEGYITAENEGRRIFDGEVQAACASACPSQAIIFGDVNGHTIDKQTYLDTGEMKSASRVKHAKTNALNYAFLEELNTVPRTSYYAKVSNPNPKLVAHVSGADSEGGH